MNHKMVKLRENGRLVIPAAFRHAMRIQPGDELVLMLRDGELKITTRQHAITRAQRTVRQYTCDGDSLVDELIAERRADAASD